MGRPKYVHTKWLSKVYLKKSPDLDKYWHISIDGAVSLVKKYKHKPTKEELPQDKAEIAITRNKYVAKYQRVKDYDSYFNRLMFKSLV